MDVHDWDDAAEANEELAKSITSQMIKDAVEQTTKSRGNLPGDLENILDIWRRKTVISWKKELRRIVASKTGKRVETIKRRNRRFPGRKDLRGTKSTRDKHEIVVGIDTSGSMSDDEIFNGLSEIYELVKNHAKELKIIQIDTNIKSIETFDKNTKTFNRRGYGGTYMAPVTTFIEEQNLKPDVLIMISDMEIEDVSTENIWMKWKPHTLWLSTTGIIPVWNGYRKHRVIDIANK